MPYFSLIIVGLLSVCTSYGVLAVEIIVDPFDQTQQAISFRLPSTSWGQSKRAAPEAIGNVRFISMNAIQGAAGSEGSATTAQPILGLNIVNDVDLLSKIEVVWDGNGFGLATDPGFNGDLTSDGTNDGLLVGLPDPLVGNMDLYFDMQDQNQRTSSIQAQVDSSYMGDLFLAFDRFSADPSFDLTQLYSITMLVSSADLGFRGRIAFVKAASDPTPAPTPAPLPLLLVGLTFVLFFSSHIRVVQQLPARLTFPGRFETTDFSTTESITIPANWRRILVCFRAAATRPQSFSGRFAATSMPEEKTSQVVCCSTEIA
jgi:hypothetical protein